MGGNPLKLMRRAPDTTHGQEEEWEEEGEEAGLAKGLVDQHTWGVSLVTTKREFELVSRSFMLVY